MWIILTKLYTNDVVITISATAEDASQVMTAPSNWWKRAYSLMMVTETVTAMPPTGAELRYNSFINEIRESRLTERGDGEEADDTRYYA